MTRIVNEAFLSRSVRNISDFVFNLLNELIARNNSSGNNVFPIEMGSGFSGVELVIFSGLLAGTTYTFQLMLLTDQGQLLLKLMVEMMHRMAVHEFGRAILRVVAKNHSKVDKMITNLSSPTSPGYTMYVCSFW